MIPSNTILAVGFLISGLKGDALELKNEALISMKTDRFFPVNTKMVLGKDAYWRMGESESFTEFHQGKTSESTCKNSYHLGYDTEVCFNITEEGFQVHSPRVLETVICRRAKKCSFKKPKPITIRGSTTPSLPPRFYWSSFYQRMGSNFNLLDLNSESVVKIPALNSNFTNGTYSLSFKAITWQVRGYLRIESESREKLHVNTTYVALNYIIETPLKESDGIYGIHSSLIFP